MAAKPNPPDVTELMKDGRLVDEALRRGVREALRRHRDAGQPVVVWRDGKVVWVPANELDELIREESQPTTTS
jgi:transposase InsO family protein